MSVEPLNSYNEMPETYWGYMWSWGQELYVKWVWEGGVSMEVIKFTWGHMGEALMWEY